ncbi:MAG TPA: ferritin-like domain-containing protein [Nitrospiria bacterium]|jgi:rubrerythrin
MKPNERTLTKLMADLQDEYNSLEKYRFQAEKVPHPVVKAKLEKLCEIERKHVQVLEKVLGLHMEVHVNSEKPAHQEGRSVHEMLAQDYEDERQAYLRYQREYEETEDEELKKLLKHLAQDELAHMDLLKEIYRTLV